MKDTDERLERLCELALAWNTAGVHYSVTHGIDDYPRTAGRDLDLLASEQEADRALLIARDVLHRAGYDVAFPPRLWGPRLIALGVPGWANSLEIHFVARLAWRGVVFCSEPMASEMVGPFAIDPWAAWVKRVLLPLLSGRIQRLREDTSQLKTRDGELAAVRMRLPQFLGEDLCTQLLGLTETPIAPDDATLAILRSTLLRRAARHRPFQMSGEISRLVVRKLSRPLRPASPIVALVGPDGSGKSTLANSLKAGDQSLFTGVVVRHWRPAVIPRLSAWIGKPAPSASDDGLFRPRREAGRFELVRILYYGLDFLVGYWIKDRIDSSHQRLVIYDRHAIDMSVDPVRYGLRRAKRARRLYRLIPKPNLTILLHGDPATAHERKPELQLEEIERQLVVWESLVEEGLVHPVKTVHGSPQSALEEVRESIIRAFLTMNSTRL